MKRIYLILIAGVIFSCGAETNETADDATQSDNENVAEEVVKEPSPDEDMAPPLPTYEPENADGQWQIDDYAEMFVGGTIYASWDDIPEEQKGGAGQIYEVLDLKGGFAKVTGAYEGWHEYVLWRMDDGYDLLGTMSVGCGPVCDYEFHFYKCKGEKVENISMAKLFPIAQMDDHANEMQKKIREKYEYLDYPNDKAYIYHFPQKGTSMKVDLMIGAEEVIVPIFKLSWDKQRFSIEEKYSEVPDPQ